MMYDEMLVRIEWSACYNPAWDNDAEAYLLGGVLPEGRNRRLGKLCDPACNFTAYLGVQHYDPLMWSRDGTPRTTFWVSFLIGKRTLALRSFATLDECRALLYQVYRQLICDSGL